MYSEISEKYREILINELNILINKLKSNNYIRVRKDIELTKQILINDNKFNNFPDKNRLFESVEFTIEEVKKTYNL
jgi:hypothetical protein